MAAQVTNYQCPLCTAPLHFHSETGKLECEYCGSSFSVKEIESFYAQKDEKAVQAQAAADAEQEQLKKEEQAAPEDGEDASGWDLSGVGSEWGAEAGGIRVYNCPSCGAELICDQTTAATACPYCDNPTIIPGQLGGTLKPDYVIPFKLDKKHAIEALKKHYRKRPLLPRAFKTANHLEEIKGVYVPFWLFGGAAEGRMDFDATRSRVYQRGDYEITETKHFEVVREGNISFEHIPVDGSRKMPDDYMDSLEPFDYSEMRDFSTAYLPGYLADKYDVSAQESCKRADERASSTLSASLRGTVKGYSQVTQRNKNIRLHRDKVKYALLPVWLLRTKWEGKEYLFAMNGQTGKFVGDLPTDKKKKRRAFWGTYVLFVLIMLLWIMDDLQHLFAL